MKSLILLLVVSSVAFAKPAIEGSICDTCISLVNDFYGVLESQLKQAEEQIKEMCAYLPEEKRQECIDALVKELEDAFNQFKSELPPRKACEYLHLCRASSKLSVADESKETIFLNLPKMFQGFGSIWDKIACSQCKLYHNYLHEAFKNAEYKKRYLDLGKRLCPDKECVKKLEALVKSISKETDVKKACKPVCTA